ncbi:MAG: beta-propeller domain-containing protein, partial [Candidatus Binatia bacterium]
VDGVVRIVLRRSQPDIGFVQPQVWSPPVLEKALETNRDVVRKATADQWIPRYTLEARGGRRSGALSSCASTYAPRHVSGFGSITVVTVDPSDPVPREGSTVVGGGDIVYASRDGLYVTTQRWGDPRPLADPAVGVPDIAPVDPGETEIHKFDIRDAEARYVASGKVRGTLLSQWSMSEHEGFLRVASTAGPSFAALPEEVPASESFVTVLAQRDEVLAEVGRVGGLGRGERIYAVRFIGDVGYVVTFRQVDPLYTLDLSDPTRPRVVGELKIPGYSSYLHPVGDGLVLGVGQEATDEGRVLGTQLSLFDVRDPAAPKRLAQLGLGGGSSGAEYDHHAFLWWPPSKLAVLPLQLYPVAEDGSGQYFAGAVGLRVDADIEEVGRLSHPAPADSFAGISRALVAGGALYTVSESGVMRSDLGSLERSAWVSFAQ